MYNILDYGAKRNTFCTKSVQAAIEACAENGGGVVLIPAGSYEIGTIWLRSNVELHLETGAVLKASENMDDYNEEDSYVQNYGVPVEKWRGKHLIIALECDNVAITGNGIIDGSGDAFFGGERLFFNDIYAWDGGHITSKDEKNLRPGQCICFIECTNVKVTDVFVKNTPCWTIFFHGCEYVQIRGVKITNPFDHVNTDGLDIDCCRYVTVSDCIIKTGDDAIAIRCDSEKLKNPKPCEYVTVSNCVLASNSSVFRIGVGTGEIRHVRISNLAISRAGNIVSYCTSWEGIGKAEIEDVTFSDITANNVCRVLSCDVDIGSVKKSTLKNLNAAARGGVFIRAKNKESVSGLTLENIDLKVDNKRLPQEKNLIHVVNTNDVTLDSVNVLCKKEDWESVFYSNDNNGLEIKNCNF